VNIRRVLVVALVLVSFTAGIAANNIYHKRRSAAHSASASSSAVKQQEIDRLIAVKEQDLRTAIQLLAKLHGNTASVLNRRERILSQMMEDLSGINGSSIYNIGIHRYYNNLIEEYLGSSTRARVLEIGPGINLGTGLLFAMSGTRKYYGLDIYKDPDLLGIPQYESIVKLLSLIAPDRIKIPAESIMKIAGGQVSFDKDKIEYLYPRQSYDIPLADGSLDYVFSHAAFEHIADPLKTIAAIHKVLRKGGITAHQIDLRDHRDFSKPLEFLKIDAATWKDSHKNPATAYLYMNRWRSSEFKDAFEKHGFQILKVQPTTIYPVSDELRKSLHRDFQNHSLEDLSVVGVMIIAKKP
jgi:SAM-dependent methyltransferase